MKVLYTLFLVSTVRCQGPGPGGGPPDGGPPDGGPPDGGPPAGGGGGGGGAQPTDAPTIGYSVVPCADTIYSELCDNFLINEDGYGAVMTSYKYNVQSVEVATYMGEDYLKVTATGMPDYTLPITDDIIDALNSRPFVDTKFPDGLLIQSGDIVQFGQDIGYAKFEDTDCIDGEGNGWWPIPTCPYDKEKVHYFPLKGVPAEPDEICWTDLDSVGTLVNGAALYNYWDAQTYEDEGVWYNIAPEFEQYDLDLCSGHAANGMYHHHGLSACLVYELGDDGSQHSPLYGVAADGYAIYGPWQAADTPTMSCWKARNYDDGNDITSCGVGNEGLRTCLLKNIFDPTEGTVPAPFEGPTTSDTFVSLSKIEFSTVSGRYSQDFYYDSTCTGSEGIQYLDEHNGHSHEPFGYHYHYTATFPYAVGPTFYGRMHSNAIHADKCETASLYIPDGTVATVPDPTIAPTPSPTPTPTPSPTPGPTPSPTPGPTLKPTFAPSPAPTFLPTDSTATSTTCGGNFCDLSTPCCPDFNCIDKVCREPSGGGGGGNRGPRRSTATIVIIFIICVVLFALLLSFAFAWKKKHDFRLAEIENVKRHPDMYDPNANMIDLEKESSKIDLAQVELTSNTE